MAVDLLDVWLAVARRNIRGFRIANAIGKNPDIDSGSLPADIWTGPAPVYPWLAAAAALEIVSTSVDDAAAGTGMRSVLVVGLDASYVEVSQVVVLNGTTPVALGTLLRINDVRAVSAGSGGENAGAITVRVVSAPATVLSHMAVGVGRSQQAIYTVPAGKTAFAVYAAFGIQRSQSDFLEMEVRSRGQGSAWVTRVTVTVSTSTPWVEVSTRLPVPFVEKTDIAVRAVTSSATNNMVATANAQFCEVDNVI